MGVVAAGLATILAYRVLQRAQPSDIAGAERNKTLVLVGAAVTAALGAGLYLLYQFPQYCNIVGIVTTLLTASLIIVNSMHNTQSSSVINPNPIL